MGIYLKHKDIAFQVGDTVKIHQRIVEGGKERIQIFEGLVISGSGHQGEKAFKVRKISGGVGVEKIYPIDSPFLEKVEIVSTGEVRRAKLYFLRELTGRSALKVKTRRDEASIKAVLVAKEASKSSKAKVADESKSEPAETK